MFNTLFHKFLLFSLYYLSFMCPSSSKQFYGVFKVRLPLKGGPRFLKLHHAIVFEKMGENSSDRFFQLDFLPLDPENPITVFELLRGGTVQGEIRFKQCCWPNEASVIESRIRQHVSPQNFSNSNFVLNYNKMLSLNENNCIDFAEAALTEINNLDSSCNQISTR